MTYTAQMEHELDEIAEGENDYETALKQFDDKFEPLLENAYANMEKIEAKKTGEICPKCGHELVERHGRYGTFVPAVIIRIAITSKKMKANWSIQEKIVRNAAVQWSINMAVTDVLKHAATIRNAIISKATIRKRNHLRWLRHDLSELRRTGCDQAWSLRRLLCLR